MRNGAAIQIDATGPSRALTPLTIPDLAGWYSPYSAANYVLGSGTSLGTVLDLSGNGRHWSAGTAAATLSANGIGTGIDGFQFVGTSSQYMTANALGAAFSGTDKPMSVFGIVKHTTGLAGGTHTIWSMGRASTTTPLRRWCTDTADKYFRQHRNDANTLYASTVIAAGLLSGGAQVLSHVAEGPGTDTGRINGTLVNASTDTASGVTTLDEMAFGCFLNGAVKNQFWDGVIGELLFYARAVTNEERLRIEEYLMIGAGLP